MLSRYSLSDASIFRSSRERRAANRMSSRVRIQGMRRLRRSQARNASRLAATLAGSSGTANAGRVTSMTGNLRPSAVVANTTPRPSAAGRWDCMTGSRYAARRRHRGTTGNKSTARSYGAAMPRRYVALRRAVNVEGTGTLTMRDPIAIGADLLAK